MFLFRAGRREEKIQGVKGLRSGDFFFSSNQKYCHSYGRQACLKGTSCTVTASRTARLNWTNRVHQHHVMGLAVFLRGTGRDGRVLQLTCLIPWLPVEAGRTGDSSQDSDQTLARGREEEGHERLGQASAGDSTGASPQEGTEE